MKTGLVVVVVMKGFFEGSGQDNSTVCDFSSGPTSQGKSCTPVPYNGSLCMEQLLGWQHCALGDTNTVQVDSKSTNQGKASVILEFLSKCMYFLFLSVSLLLLTHVMFAVDIGNIDSHMPQNAPHATNWKKLIINLL